MALPIWGLFMQKVYKDPTIPIGKDDHFVPPLGWNMSFSCTGSLDDMTSGNESRDNFFE